MADLAFLKTLICCAQSAEYPRDHFGSSLQPIGSRNEKIIEIGSLKIFIA